MSITYVDGVTPADAAHFNNLQQKVEKAAANGYASLDSGGKVPLAQLPPVGADLIYDGDFAAGPTYKDGEIVVYQDASGNKVAYMCTSPTTSAPTPWPGGPPAQLAYPRPTYGTTLPATPVDGQEHILVDSTTNPTYQWHFRYNASSSSAYKWEFVGGSELRSDVGTSETTSSASYVELTTPQRLTLPRAGDYAGTFFVSATSNTAGDTLQVTGGWWHVPGQVSVANGTTQLASQARMNGLAAGAQLMLQFARPYGTGIASFSNRSFSVRPVRVS